MNQETTWIQELIRTARQKAMMEWEEHHTRYPGNGWDDDQGEWTSDDGDDYTTEEANQWVQKRISELLQEAIEPMKQALMDN